MHPSERIKHITSISSELSKEEWGLLDLTLKQFGLPWTEQWSGGKEDYIVEMLSEADEASLLELAKHLGVASQLETTKEPAFWSSNEVRIFLSHLSTMKIEVSKLRDQLVMFGIKAFVAHEDIEPTKEWQTEIESALSTMDGLIAFLTPGFKESSWCDQEVGVAIGRQLPIISVRHSLDPYGFIGKYQALQGLGKQSYILAKELFNILIESPIIGPKMTGALVYQLAHSNSYEDSKRTIKLINSASYLTSKHVAAMKEAVSENRQVYSAWRVPEKINEIVRKYDSYQSH